MNTISDIIISTPCLPSRFITGEYDKFLFFDFFLRGNEDFFKELQKTVIKNTEIDIFYSKTLSLLGHSTFHEKWSKKIKLIDEELNSQKECFGLVVSEYNRSWIIVQDSPVNLGVFAFNGSNLHALHLFNIINRDWFLSLEDFERAVTDPTSALHENFDMVFIKTLVDNYKLAQKKRIS